MITVCHAYELALQMSNHLNIIKWATNCLISNGYSLQSAPEIIQETPWSNVIQLFTSQGDFYLKQPAPLLAQEAKVIKLLATHFHANVPQVIEVNDDLHCFLMQDAGISIRKYLKAQFQPNLLCESIKKFTAFQRSTENNIELFFTLDIPDWRLNQLVQLYRHIINQTEFLKADGITDQELQTLHDLIPHVTDGFEQLLQYKIPATIVQPDFNTNNILFNPDTHQFTFIDLGELAITHPFFSLHNFLYTATVHHGIQEKDATWDKLEKACIENWLDRGTMPELLTAFKLSKVLWHIYSACVNYRFMHCVDLKALNAWYANKPHRLASDLRAYIALASSF